MTKRFLGILIVISILLTTFSVSVSAADIVKSGTCGDNLTWTLDDKGELTIFGEGAMTDSGTPWYSQKENIKKLTIKNGVTSIMYNAFSDCVNLTSISIPGSVMSIEDGAFSYCENLTSVAIDNGLTDIGNYVFNHCDNLINIILPNTVKNIGRSAFCMCSNLVAITIPNSVTSIGEQAFFGCKSLISVKIPDDVTSIGNKAFCGCDTLTEITIPKNVCVIGISAFSACDNLTSINVDMSNPYFSSKNGILFNKDETKIVAFPSGKTGDYKIPDSVINIGERAFFDCNNLKNIIIHKNVNIIETGAFCGCDNLTSINIDSDNLYYSAEDGILFDKNKTKILAVPCGKTGDYKIPDTITRIEDYAFYDCRNLNSITIPDSVTSMGAYSFYNCRNLNSITIPINVTSIEDCTFTSCHSLVSIIIPDGVVSIGSNAFSNCASLVSVTIPDRVTITKGSIFAFCYNITDIYYGGSITKWNSLFTKAEVPSETTIHCAQISSGTFGNNITWTFDNGELSISGNGAMIDANNSSYTPWYDIAKYIKTINIDNGVTSIGRLAFYHCENVSSIIIPDSVTSIGPYAFSWCDKLTDVIYSGSQSQWSIISILNPNEILKNAIIHFGYDDTCGKDLKWYRDANGNLIISGTGEMTNWDNATDIPWYAKRHDIKNIMLENGATSIGNYAFFGCDNLVSVIIPESVTDISFDAFTNCANLKYVFYYGSYQQWTETFDFPVNADVICAKGDKNGTCGDNLIWELKDDGELIIGGIGAMNCSGSVPWSENKASIKKVTIIEGVTSIFEDAFSDCCNLTNVTIPNTVTGIGKYAFSNCISLTNIIIPNSVTSIGRNAFADCAGLTEITIPESAKVVEKYAFSCTNLKKVYWNADSAVDYWPYEYVQKYPAQFFGTDWPPNAVYNYPYGGPPVVGAKNMEVIFGDNVTRIPNYMFYDVANLESLTIPRSLTKIGMGALQGKTTLTINYKGNQEEWESVDKGHDLYYYSSQYEEHIGDVTIIHNDSYPGQCAPKWPNYAYINFLDEPQEINSGTCGDNAYWELSDDGTLNITGIGTIVYGGWDRSRINTVNIGYGIEEISYHTFNESANLTDVYMADSVKRINGFNNCKQLKNIELSKSLKYIGGFSGCTSLTNVTIPYSVTEIGSSAFEGCTSLKSVTIPYGVTIIGSSAFEGCTSLADINIPKSVTRIGSYAFYGCMPFKNIIIPESVIIIDSSAFCNCTIKSITLSCNADFAGDAFKECTIEKVYLNAPTYKGKNFVNFQGFYMGGSVEELYIGENVETMTECIQVARTIYWNSTKVVFAYEEEIPHRPITPFNGSHTSYVVMGDGVTKDMISKFFVHSEHIQFVREIPKTQTTIYDNNDGTLNLTITLPDIEIPDTAKMYVSGMSNGVLKNLTSVQDFSSDTINVTVNKNDKIKIFLWDKNMKPLTISEIVDVP